MLLNHARTTRGIQNVKNSIILRNITFTQSRSISDFFVAPML